MKNNCSYLAEEVHVLIYKVELIEGDEIFYTNPYSTIALVGANADDLKAGKGHPLSQGESISIKAKYIYVKIA